MRRFVRFLPLAIIAGACALVAAGCASTTPTSWRSALDALPLLVAVGIVDAATWATKMVDRIKASGDAWLKGVQNPRRSPTAQMKLANGKWKNNTQAAITADRWNKAITTLTDDSIKTAAAAVGSQRFIDGVSTRTAKVTAAISKLQPKVAAVSQSVQAMPQDTDTQREARMVSNLRGMRAIKNT